MSGVGFANTQIANKKTQLQGKLEAYQAKQGKQIETVKQSYQDKYGDASIFDVANNSQQKNINTQSEQAQTPQNQNKMSSGSSDTLANALIKMNTIIASVVDSFGKVMEDIKQSLYKLSTQDAGQQSSTPKDNIGINNQGTGDQAKTSKAADGKPEVDTPDSKMEVQDDSKAPQGKGEKLTNENEAESSSQIDKQFLKKLNTQYAMAEDNSKQAIDKNMKEIERLAAASGTSATDT